MAAYTLAMMKQMSDLIAAVIVLVAGVVMLAMDEGELGGLAVTTSLGYLFGAFRDKPGGYDEAVRLGGASVMYEGDDEGDEDAEVA